MNILVNQAYLVLHTLYYRRPVHKMTQGKDTETTIFDAARSVFIEQGFYGARMSEIARRAGINQSMLHYYFRSKDLLFDSVFNKAAMEAIPPVIGLLSADLPISEKIDRFIRGYVQMIMANPHLPAFILQELRRNPEALKTFVGGVTEGVLEGMTAELRLAADRGEIRPVEPRHFLANLLALCVFPFIARPMLQTAFDADDSGYDVFLAQRSDEISDFVRNALRP